MSIQQTLRIKSLILACVGATLLVMLTQTPMRQTLEASMSLHMLVQYPALMLVGVLLGAALQVLPEQIRSRLSTWNVLGISGLVACALLLAVLMIPRVLDLALTDSRVEAAKVAVLIFVGMVLWPSWRAAGLIVQGFFLGNSVPMMFIVGTLYQDSPQRLCNAYRLDDQQNLGGALMWLAVVVAVLWLLSISRRLVFAGDVASEI